MIFLLGVCYPLIKPVMKLTTSLMNFSSVRWLVNEVMIRVQI